MIKLFFFEKFEVVMRRNFLLVIILLCFLYFVAESQTYKDSCLVLVEEKFIGVEANPDSVLIDTCLCPDEHWTVCEHLYAKQWYSITLPQGAVNLPKYRPYDTVYITWQDIDTSFQTLRNLLYEMTNIFGNNNIKKRFPSDVDTNSIGSRIFWIKFENYCKIDSVVNYLRVVPEIDAGYANHIYQPVDVVENNSNDYLYCIDIFPQPAKDYLDLIIHCKILTGNLEIINIYGKTLKIFPKNNLLTFRIDISDLTPGLYFIRIGIQVKQFIIN
jgi:hypothetical protein